MIERMITKIRRNSGPVLLLVGILLALFLGIFYSLPEDESVSEPTIVTPSIDDEDSEDRGTASLVNVNPPSGKRSSLDTFQVIAFTFSEPVDPNKVEVTVTPQIELKMIQGDRYPNKITVLPSNKGWKNEVEYGLVLRSSEFTEPVEYTYFNTPPDTSTTPFPY